MVTLKEYIGTIVSSVNNARGMADVESAKLAKQYAADDVLQYYTVPRMRMQDVELEIPVGIDSFNTKNHPDYQPIDNNSFYSHTYNTIKDAFEVTSFDRETSKNLSRVVKNEIQNLESQLKKYDTKEEYVKKFSERIAEESMSLIKRSHIKNKEKQNIQDTKFPQHQHITSLLNKRLVKEILPRLQAKTIEDANVIVESDKLSTIQPDKLIKIKMKIIETGMEWHQMEDANGELKSKLVSE